MLYHLRAESLQSLQDPPFTQLHKNASPLSFSRRGAGGEVYFHSDRHAGNDKPGAAGPNAKRKPAPISPANVPVFEMEAGFWQTCRGNPAGNDE
ncbi:MAG TPA: hypothetical protein VFB38_23940 [Chthonomonadaceae bacterium]|nr:hypothetical protein [Chthonomonadaceae bacterium]